MFNFFKSKRKFNLSKGFNNAEDRIRKKSKNKIDLANNLRLLAKESFESYPYDSLRIMNESNELVPQDTKLKWIGFRLYDLGKVSESFKILDFVPKKSFTAVSEQNKLKKIIGEYNYLNFIDENINEKEKLNTEFKKTIELKSKKIKKYATQEDWYREAKLRISEIRNSAAQRFFKKSCRNIGIICEDKFLKYVEPAANFIYITPSNYDSFLSENSKTAEHVGCDKEQGGAGKNKIDLLLITSTWLGIDGVWRGLTFKSENTNAVTEQGKVLIECIRLCHEQKIPVVFYFTESAAYCDLFDKYAVLSDYIYTADASILSLLKGKYANARIVEYMPLGINPLINNPIGKNNVIENDSVIYSSGWINSLEDRSSWLNKTFNSINDLKFNFHVLDNLANIKLKEYSYPEHLKNNISEGSSEEQINKIHKLADWSVNYNPYVSGSRFISFKEFELQANGCLVLSNYNEELINLLPTSFVVNDSLNIVDYMKKISKEEMYNHRLLSVRTIMSKHTCFNRVNRILKNAELDSEFELPKILVIGEQTQNNFENFNRQTYPNKVFISPDNAILELVSGFDAVTWFDDNYYYGEFYLEDSLDAFIYTDSDFVTKDCYIVQRTKFKSEFVDGVENDFISSFKSKTSTVFWVKSFDLEKLLSMDMTFNVNHKGYSVDHANLIENYDLYVKSNQMPPYYRYRLSVVIPVYNNGFYLYNFAFLSLLSCSKFSEMEIIIVDDGSYDQDTISIINFLVANYKNVKSYFFSGKCSGSASRPRNKGIELATGEYILFLDPDDQCINDGYSLLIKETDNEDFDLVIGNNYSIGIGKTRTESNNYKYLNTQYHVDFYENESGIAESEIDFRTIRIQSMLIFTNFLKQSNLRFKEGAIGEDTLFSWCILKLSKRFKFSNNFTHIYYSAIENSVTNNINSVMFEKLLLIQKDKIQWLQSNDQLDYYLENKFEDYTLNLVLKRMELVQESEREQCMVLVKNILSYYKDFYKGSNELILNLMDLKGANRIVTTQNVEVHGSRRFKRNCAKRSKN